MFKDDYRRELDKLTASEKFRQDTISLMQERQEQLNQENKTAKIIKFTPKPYRKIAASAAVALLAVGTMIFAATTGGLMTGADNATETEAIDYVMEHETENGQQADDITADTFPALAHQKNSRVYTIDDAVEIASADFKAAEKITFSTESSGGMGFEGLMYYDISELNTKNAFYENIVLDTLPVYKFSPMSSEDIEHEFHKILDKTGMTEDDITRLSFEWIELGQDGNRTIIMETLYTDTPEKPSDTAQLYWIKVELNDGYIEIRPRRSLISLYLYDDRPDDDRLLGSYTARNYTHLFGNNLDNYVYGDYNIYGEQHFSPHYLYEKSDEYSQSVFNNSVNSIIVWSSDSLWKSDNDKGENIHFQYAADCAYTKAEELPAISWQEALTMLYDGRYLSTVPEKTPENRVVSKIELVYKSPPYYPPADYQAGYALPFYKLYVELPSYTFETDKGTLKSYGIYYVCAIHPDYVEYTDGYLNFN